MSGWFRAQFLLSSFMPLYVVLACELYVQRAKTGVWWMLFAALVFAAIIVFVRLQSGFKSKSPAHFKVDTVSALDEGIISYILSYVPPFFIDDFSQIEKLTPAIAFYIVLIILMWRIDTLHINPVFLICGYRIFRVRLDSGRFVVIITRRPEVLADDRLSLYEIQPSKLYYAE